MFALAYVSKATTLLSKQEFSDLVVLAGAKNRSLAVTGFLQYKEGQFFQYLEGDKDVVLDLMDMISGDSRHTILRVIHLPGVESRQFDSWHMRYITNEKFNSVNLVDLLENVLLTLTDPDAGDDDADKKVMRLVTDLAELYYKFPHTFDA